MFLKYDREELYQKIWERPLIKVAEEYGVSAVALGKTCRKLASLCLVADTGRSLRTDILKRGSPHCPNLTRSQSSTGRQQRANRRSRWHLIPNSRRSTSFWPPVGSTHDRLQRMGHRTY